MAIHELAVFPHSTLSAGQGLVGTRKWMLNQGENVTEFVQSISEGHWPGNENAIAVMIQVGAFDEKLRFAKEGDSAAPDDELPHYEETLIVAQYQFLQLNEKWPHCIPKPAHPLGTTLSLRVRGSGQFLTMPPGGFIADGVDKQVAFTQNDNCRIVIPITEYHLTCDRLLAGDVPHWKWREGSVNSDEFLGERPESLLFDTWEIDHSFAANAERMPRYKLTCVLRCRDIQVGAQHFGWNHDYHGDQWVRIKIKDGDEFHNRYPLKPFERLFTDNGCDAGSDSGMGSIGSDSGGF